MKHITQCSLLSLVTLLGLGCSNQPGAVEERVGEVSQRLTQCVTFQRGANGTFSDAVVSSAKMDTNDGAGTTLITSDKQAALLWVDVASIPSYAIVNSATLKLYVNATGNGNGYGVGNGNGNGPPVNTGTEPINLHRATAAWAENSVTYASFAQHFDPIISGVIQPSADSSLKQVDLTTLVQSWVNGSQQNQGVVLETIDTKRTIFVSSESAATTLRPALEVCYAVPDEHCDPNPCQNAGTCINGWEGYTCECTPGYTGTNCEINIDDCVPGLCQNGGTCSDLVNGYTCTCADGFTGANCETNIDECAGAPCQNGGVCIDGINAYSCTCPPGFTGTNCETEIDECASNPCLNGAVCSDLVNSYACTCAAGFSGTNCETNIDECVGNACQNNASCIDDVAAYACACMPGFAGTYCETNIDDCAGAPCLHDGACTDDVNGYTCACAPGYTGTNCEVDINDCAGSPCQHDGLCVDGVNSYTCTCPDGWTGTSCDLDIDECAESDPCHVSTPDWLDFPQGVACVNTPGSFTCECAPIYGGETCEIACPCYSGPPSANDFPTGMPWVYLSYGVIPAADVTVDASGTISFTMDNGNLWASLSATSCTGDVGGMAASSPGGLTHYPVTPAEYAVCKKAMDLAIGLGDACLSNPCQNGGTCTTAPGSYTCACPDGWTGTNCEVDVDECAAGDPCHVSTPDMLMGLPPGTACVNTPGSFTCECAPLNAGTTCEIACPCYEDAFMMNDMPTGAPWAFGGTGQAPPVEVSVDASGVTKLTLVTGYGGSAWFSLSATSCTGDVDDMAASSPAGLTHYPLTPVEHAACLSGINFAIDLVSLDSCAGNPCQNGGTCSTTAPASYTCICPGGFAGTNCETVCPTGYGGANCSTAFTYCALVKSQNPAATDGIYNFDIAGHSVDLYCHDMNGTPTEYLPLDKTGAGFNFSTYAPNQTTTYTKVRFHPDTLTVDITDATFSTTVGTNVHGTPNVAYATAADCIATNSQAGTANVDLTGTPFALAPNQFVTEGWYPAGSIAYGSLNKTANLTGGGYCGATTTANGTTPLQLVFQADAPSCAPGNTLLQGACQNWFGNNIDVATIEASGLWDISGTGPWGSPLPGVNCTDATTSDLGFIKSCALHVDGIGSYECESDCINNQCCALPRED